MDQLTYLFQLAFSGSDAVRAMWLALIGALVSSKYLPPFRVTIILLIIDRIWPFVMMGLAGYDVRAISASLGHAITSIPNDILMIFVRGLILYIVIVLGYHLRLRLHGKRATLATGKRG